jgi:hypothetical protein
LSTAKLLEAFRSWLKEAKRRITACRSSSSEERDKVTPSST